MPTTTPPQPAPAIDAQGDAALRGLANRWAAARAAERANYQLYLIELTEALRVERPRPAGSGYEFEHAVKVVTRDGVETTNFIDLLKADYFVLEAKDDATDGGRAPDLLLRKAFGQARTYASALPGEQPPYLLVLDVGKTLLVWDRWNGSYGGYNAGRRIDLRALADRPDDVALLRDIWERPHARDPRSRAAAVTKEIAGTLAELAASLESRGHDQEAVARFLMRCVFTMFAEDVGLLADEPFRTAVEEIGLRGTPGELSDALTELWTAMDEGKRFGLRRLLKFNGHFFKDHTALPLAVEDMIILRRAARADWKDVEPAIFGTLLTRALDPVERHRLGAEYTPPAFIERVVRPTVEEPIRERWTAVQAEVLQLRETGRRRDLDAAVARLDEFHTWLRRLRFLDPACGSGNFLYVTLNLVKNVEVEVMHAREELTGEHQLRIEEVTPAQFFGIEVKPWAREIAELTLWIGFHQFWRRHHDAAVQPPEPILQDTGTLACRDAVLAWDSVERDLTRDRRDPTPRVPHPVSGELVPDATARRPYMEYVGARPTPWPEVDFIIGNPPYLGEKRQREVLGDGYVDALRSAYPDTSDSADYVTYWWHRAADLVAAGSVVRAGLITTNSLTQAKNRVVIEQAAARGAGVAWAIADHVWYDGADGAEVRVAMTVIAKDPPNARLLAVERVEKVQGEVRVVSEMRVPRLNADLTTHADVASTARTPLLANAGLAYQGFKRGGEGFVLSAEEAETLLKSDPRAQGIVRPYRNGKDVTARPRGVYVIDMALRDETEAREHPVLFDRLRDRVYPERVANPRESYARYWWRFLEPRRELRDALAGLTRYIATSEVSKHPIFAFLNGEVAPDGTLVCIASDDGFVLGVLSSAIHTTWAHAAGGRMGVRHTPRYSKSICFDGFPFPQVSAHMRRAIGAVAERVDRHRAEALARSADVTVAKLYDVVSALRTGTSLTPAQRETHAAGACGVLRDLHDELDRLVAEAYGWSWPEPAALVLERLVALHDERVAEEKHGVVRWLRPEYQAARFGVAAPDAETLSLGVEVEPATSNVTERRAWPSTAIEQIAALKAMADDGAVSVDDALARFTGARRDLVARHFETLALMGELQQSSDGKYDAIAVSVA